MYFIESKNCYLKKLSLEHCTSEYLGWLNDPEVNRYLETGDFPTSTKDLQDYINQIPRNELFLAIHSKENNSHIGNIRIHKIDFKNGLAEYGIMIGDKTKWGKGYAREVSIEVLRHCFNRLNLRKITLGVFSNNTSAIKSYEKMGFLIEGNYKEHLFHENKYEDIIRMAIFKNQFNDMHMTVS